MGALLFALLTTARDTLRRRTDLEAELLASGTNSSLLQRQRGPRRVPLRSADRLLWVVLSRVWALWRDAVILVKPETVIDWQRRGFRSYWRGKSRGRPPGRPTRAAIRRGRGPSVSGLAASSRPRNCSARQNVDETQQRGTRALRLPCSHRQRRRTPIHAVENGTTDPQDTQVAKRGTNPAGAPADR